MDIRSIIRNEIISFEQSLMLDVNSNTMKTMVFVNNISNRNNEPVLAVLDIPVLDSVELVTLNEFVDSGEALNVLNLLGDETVYCVWGHENIEPLKDLLSKYNYYVSNNTVFIDLKKIYCDTYSIGDLTIEAIANEFVENGDSSLEDLSIKGNISPAKIMHKLMTFMILDNYKNNDMNLSIIDALAEKKELYLNSRRLTNNFRNEKSTLTLTKAEFKMLNEFSKNMIEYHEAMEDVYNRASEDNDIIPALRKMAKDKALISRYKINAHKFAINSIKATESSEYEENNIYFKTMELYSLVDDAMEMIRYINEDSSLCSFVAELAEPFMSAGARAYSYLLRRNIVSVFVDNKNEIAK